MQILEIAGLKVNYRNAPDLAEQVKRILAEVKTERTQVEERRKILKQQETKLERFLGETTKSEAKE